MYEKKFFYKHIVEANLLIFFRSLIEVYGYMDADAYDFVKFGKISNKKEKIFIPEQEFLELINKKGFAFLDFNSTYEDCYKKCIKGTSFIKKIKYRNILKEQLIFHPNRLKNSLEVHEQRKRIIKNWLVFFSPFIDKYHSLSNLFFPLDNPEISYSSDLLTLKHALKLLRKRDLELNKNDLNSEIEYLEKSMFFKNLTPPNKNKYPTLDQVDWININPEKRTLNTGDPGSYEKGIWIWSSENRREEFLRHNLTGPAVKRNFKSEDQQYQVWETEYWVFGGKHRVNGPQKETITEYEGKKWTSYDWIQSGKYHRTDGPAYLSFKLLKKNITDKDYYTDYQFAFLKDGSRISSKYFSMDEKEKTIVLEQMDALGASEFEPSWYSTNIFLQGYVDQQFLSLLSKYNHILLNKV